MRKRDGGRTFFHSSSLHQRKESTGKNERGEKRKREVEKKT